MAIRVATGAGVGLLIVGLLLLSFLLAPLISIAALNTISEQSNFGWYIPHNFWTYLSVWGLAITFRGGSAGKSKG